MKEHGSKLPAEQPAKILKSLLKKPGQSKARSQKNRVVINEKLNEFFAADYIILIKEECCADYEEDCDCCCQEHEFLRLGNCKECRAELNLHFGISDDNDPRYRDVERDEEITLGGDMSRDKGCDGERFNCGELHAEDAEEEEEEEEEEEVEEEEEEEEEEYEGEECEIGDEGEEVIEDAMESMQRKKGRKPETREMEPKEAALARDRKKRTDEFRTDASNRRQMAESRDAKPCMISPANSTTVSLSSSPPTEPPPPPPPPPPPRSQSTLDRSMYSSPLPRQEPQQQETLSPPEGYKDVCSNGEVPAEMPPTQCLRSSLDHLRSRRTPGEPLRNSRADFCDASTRNSWSRKTSNTYVKFAAKA